MSATPLKIHDNERDAAEESFPDFSFKISCAIWVCQSTTTTLYKIHIPDIFFYYSPNKRREKKEKKNTSGILLVVFRESIDMANTSQQTSRRCQKNKIKLSLQHTHKFLFPTGLFFYVCIFAFRYKRDERHNRIIRV
jgi:hypothetical protein